MNIVFYQICNMYKISSQNTQNWNRTRKHPLLKGVAGQFSTGLGILGT